VTLTDSLLNDIVYAILYKRENMPSIKDVARVARVSVATVSRVVNNSLPVNKDTRERVEEAIRLVNYKPNLLARSLRGKSGNVIGLVVPGVISYPFFSYIINHIEDSIIDAGYNMMLGIDKDDPAREEKFIEDMMSMNVSGIIFSRVSDRSKALHILEKTDIPIVILDRILANEGIPNVVVDNPKAGRLAAAHLYNLGHRSVGCITGPMEIALSRDRLRGFKGHFAENGITIPDNHIIEGDFKFESGIKAVEHFKRQDMPCTAIWAQNDFMALGIMRGFYNEGIRIPDAISLLGMDDIDVGTMVSPSLTTLRQPYQLMCKKAVELILLEKEKGKDNLEQKQIVLEPELVVRESTRKL
jgi:DNA-binding LacI/PurR family transcriptional regulator